VGQGTGLGLSIVHGIIKSYGGAINFESSLGKGTTFYVYLLIMLEGEVKKNLVPEELLQPGAGRILFVDDDEAITGFGKNMLKRLGYSVVTSNSSQDALDIFKADAETFDLVITDYTMPDMTGLELSQEILRVRPELPIILCTGYNSQIYEEKVKNMGIREFAMKPLGQNDFSKLIRKALGKT